MIHQTCSFSKNLLTIFLIGVFLGFPLKNTVLGHENTNQENPLPAPYDFNPCIRILSIDGGGVRGIIPASILERIERKTGQPISRLFDFISGTSTGAVISLALTKPAQDHPDAPLFSSRDLVGFYERDSKLLFPPKSPVKDKGFFMKQTRYSPDPPLRLFDQTFGKTGLESSIVPVLIPTYNIKEKKPFFFKSWTKDTQSYRMSEVAGAAVAAPGYFPPARLPVHGKHSGKKGALVLVDGGVFANNPTQYALENSYQVGNIRKGLFILSLGTGKVSPGQAGKDAFHWEEARWPTALGKALFADPPGSSQKTGPQVMLRIEPVIPAENAAMDNAAPQNIMDLRTIAEHTITGGRKDFRRIVRILLKPRPAGCFREGNTLSQDPGF